MEYANLIKRLELHLPLLFSQLLPSQLEILWITLVAVILLSYKHPQEGWKRDDSTGGPFYSNICGEYCWENMSKYFKHTCARCFLKGYPPILEHCEADVIQLWTSWHQPTSQHCRSAAQEKRSRAMSRRWPQCKNNPIQRQRNIKSGDGTVTQTLEVWNCTRKTPYMHAWVGGRHLCHQGLHHRSCSAWKRWLGNPPWNSYLMGHCSLKPKWKIYDAGLQSQSLRMQLRLRALFISIPHRYQPWTGFMVSHGFS